MTQKVIKIGTSVGVTIPKQALKDLRLRAGERVEVTWNAQKGVLEIRKTHKPEVSKELVHWLEQFVEEYRPALQDLAGTKTQKNQKVARLTKSCIERYRKDLESLAKE